MKNMIKIASVAAVALALTQTLQAVPITGGVTFGGNVELGNNGTQVFTVGAANEVLAWYGNTGPGSNPYTSLSSGSLAANAGTTVTFATPWMLGVQSGLWQYTGLNNDVFTFSLTTITYFSDAGGALSVSGNGVITATGPVAFDPTMGTWHFSTQDYPQGGLFTISAASTAVPDGGATIMMLGIALSGVALLKKKLMA